MNKAIFDGYRANFGKLIMCHMIGLICLLSVSSAFSQDADFPFRCNEKLLTPTVEAHCTGLRSATLVAERGYLTALSRTDSVDGWKKVEAPKQHFLAAYYSCKLKFTTSAITACLAPEYDELLARFPTPGNEDLSDLRNHARQANANVLAKVSDVFRVCALTKIGLLDDGISSARDIATAVGPACKPQALEVASAMYDTRQLTLYSEPAPLSKLLDFANQLVSPDELVASVLAFRAEKRAKAMQQKQKGSVPRKLKT